MTVKPLMIIALFLVLSCACKLEPSSANPNANAKGSPTIASATATATEQPQSNCSLTMAAVPVTEGLRLGMTPDVVVATLPGSKDDPEVQSGLAKPASKSGVSGFVVHTDKLQPKEKFARITHFTFSLLDGRVYSINIGYNGPAYANVDDFVANFVKGSNLPPAGQWQAYPGLETQLKILTCKDFEVRVFAGGEGGNQNYVLITDLQADKQLKERRAKARAQATPTASPTSSTQ
jgi:hypothetical protein